MRRDFATLTLPAGGSMLRPRSDEEEAMLRALEANTALKVTVTVTVLLLGSAQGCSDDGQAPPADTGVADPSPADGKPTHDLPPADQGPPAPDGPAIQTINETEPNNGSTKTEFNTVSAPIKVKGAIGAADDADIFGLAAAAGARYRVTVQGDGGLQPHVVMFDTASNVPTGASNGAKHALLEYDVLEATDPLLIVVRDRRNVPASTSQHVGGPGLTYTLTLTPLTRAPIQVKPGDHNSSSLAPQGTARVFRFTAAKGTDLVLEALVSSPADVDARLSLFHVGNKSWHGTNDDPIGLDAKLSGTMPLSGTYDAIVENVADYPTKFDFTFKITKK